MDPRLIESFLHEPHRLMGKRLKPLCPWHVLLLSAAEVPVFDQDRMSKLEGSDLVIALKRASWACSRVFPDSRVESKITFMDYVRLAGGGLVRELQAWASYVDDYMSEPEVAYVEINMGGRPAPHRNPPPEPIRLVGVMMDYGMTEKQAWMTPIGAAKWYDAVRQYHEGVPIDFDTDSNRAFREAMKEKIDKKAV